MRALTINSVLHGDVLFSLPGMFSYNFWSDVPTPNQRNTTLWYRLLDEVDQQKIIADIAAAANPVVIVNWPLLQIAAAQNMSVSGPLYDYLMAEFQTALVADQFGFMVRRGRSFAPFGTAWPATEAGRVQVCLLADESPIEGIQLLDGSGQPLDLPILSVANSRVTIQPVDRNGNLLGDPRSEWPLQWQGLAWLTIESEVIAAVPSTDWALIRFSRGNGEPAMVAVRSGL